MATTIGTSGGAGSIVGSRSPFIIGQASGKISAGVVQLGSVGDAVRGFTPAELLLQRLIKQRPVDGEESAAEAIWGKPANFNVVDINNGTEVTAETVVLWPDDQAEFVTPIATINFEEVEHESEDFRIENPDDPDQYVIVRRRKSMTLRGPDLRPKELLQGFTTYPSTLAGSLARIADSFARAVGGQLTSFGAPNITRPDHAFYRITFKNDDLGGDPV